MKLKIATTLLFAAIQAGKTEAFVTHSASRSIINRPFPSPMALPRNPSRQAPRVFMSEQEQDTNDVERLRSMAAKLRAEAAALEAEQSQAKAAAAERAFRKFDRDQDGSISIEELKAGLEKEFKKELPETSVRQLMANFDKSGDGALQLDEFAGVDQLRNRLDALARDERAKAMEKTKIAKAEQAISQQLDDQLALINDKPPTGTDKILSTLPYLFPLLDGLQYASYWVLQNQDNPLANVVAVLFTLYRSIPLSGFIAFLSLSLLSGRPGINRLIRYNMQQAIFLDIALFFPGIIAFLVGATGIPVSPQVLEYSSDAVLVTLLATILYTTTSSLAGQTPDNIPLISNAVNARVPTAESLKANSEFFLQAMGIKLPEKRIIDNKNDDDDDFQSTNGSKQEEREEVKKD